MRIQVEDNDARRIDVFLMSYLNLSRNKCQKLIENGAVAVNQELVKSSYLVHLGDIIEVNSVIDNEDDISPENVPLDIVYEDEYLLVVNKPSGMVVHPGAGNFRHTLVNALMYHTDKLSGVNGKIRPGIVHRIDADTSGLLLVAKNDMVHNDLARQIKDKTVVRKYVALVNGVINEDTATIDAPIGRDPRERKKMCVTSENSKHAVTHIRVLKRFVNATLIECQLETGRTHQIRVHMNYINHPVVNDPVYGNHLIIDEEFGQMLHAKEIGFVHPVLKKFLSFTVDVPDRFREIMDIYQNE